MPVLIAAAAGLGACDEACYMAKHQTCRCICGGVNHGRGLRRAAENTRRLKEQQGQQNLFAQPAPEEEQQCT